MEHLLGLAPECRFWINRRYKTFVGTLHCALENGADFKRASEDTLGLLKEEEEELEEEIRRRPNHFFFTSRGAYIN